MRGIVFIGGDSPPPDAIKKIARGADLLIAADSGLAACEGAGLEADWVLGDMDSLQDPFLLEKYPPARVRRFPHEKDYTDTELALALARERGCDEIWISGGGGGRLDHLFAIRALFERDDSPDRWFPGSVEIRCLKEGRALSAVLEPGSVVSVFPLVNYGPVTEEWKAESWKAESFGLKWPLDSVVWKCGSYGISNLAVEGPIEIRAIRGRFMVLMPEFFSNDGKE